MSEKLLPIDELMFLADSIAWTLGPWSVMVRRAELQSGGVAIGVAHPDFLSPVINTLEHSGYKIIEVDEEDSAMLVHRLELP